MNPPDTGWTSTNASFDPAPTLSGDVCALPVELTSFTARSSGQSVTLAWETASETNNAGFDVERMAGDAWRVEGFVAGHGTTTEAQSYTHTLPGVGPGLHRFRLRQVDYDGAFEYSPEVEVLVETAGDYHLAVSGANPVRSGQATAFSLSVPVAQQVAVEVLDVSGRRVVELYRGVPVAHEPVSLRFEVPASLPSGVYVVRAQGERFVATEKVTVAK